jgi:glycosyltransferase involved in cell wall biosynthesis
MLWRAAEWRPVQDRTRPFGSLTVVIPAYNADATIAQVVRRALTTVPGALVLVVDDGSTDDTSALARSAGAEVVRQEKNRGKGASLQVGFDRALQMPYTELIATVDADLQHRPEDIPAFMEAIYREDVDIAIGSRERWGSRMPIERILSNLITSALVRARTGLPIQDSQCGFRLIRRRVLECVRLTTAGFEAETEFLIRAAQSGYRVASVPIRTIYTGERSHMTHWTTTKRFINVLMKEF